MTVRSACPLAALVVVAIENERLAAGLLMAGLGVFGLALQLGFVAPTLLPAARVVSLAERRKHRR